MEWGWADFSMTWNYNESLRNCELILGFPLWLPFLLIAIPTGFLFWSDHRRRMRVGCCEKCGYDLTGNTTGRCPECGAESVIVKKSALK